MTPSKQKWAKNLLKHIALLNDIKLTRTIYIHWPDSEDDDAYSQRISKAYAVDTVVREPERIKRTVCTTKRLDIYMKDDGLL